MAPQAGRIERALMNGENREVFVAENVIWPNGLTIDPVDDCLYWCDSYRDVIMRIDLDGTNLKVRAS